MFYHKLLQTAVLSALLCGSLAAQGPCSQETVRGVWAQWAGGSWITTTPPGGTQAVPLPGAMLGVVTVDAQGNASGWLNFMLAGNYMDLAIHGTLEISPDCTAILRSTLTPQGQTDPLPGEGVTRLFIADNGNEMQGMTVSGILGNPTGTETWRRMKAGDSAGPKCTYQNVRGLYGTTGYGFVILPGQPPMTIPWSQTGKFVIDNTGGVTGNSWASFAGQQVTYPVAGELQLLEGCTGHMTYGVGGIDRIIVLDDGDQILDMLIQSGQGMSVIGVWKRITKDTAPPSQ